MAWANLRAEIAVEFSELAEFERQYVDQAQMRHSEYRSSYQREWLRERRKDPAYRAREKASFDAWRKQPHVKKAKAACDKAYRARRKAEETPEKREARLARRRRGGVLGRPKSPPCACGTTKIHGHGMCNACYLRARNRRVRLPSGRVRSR